MTPLALSIKSEYLAWMAHLRHELYTPLNAIHGYSELLLEELEDENLEREAFAQSLTQVHQVGGRIFTLISQSLSGDTICAEAGQAYNSNSAYVEEDAVWSTSWKELKQQAFHVKLLPLSLELEQLSIQLDTLASAQFREDVGKIKIASCNFKRMIEAVLYSKCWPCDLWQKEVQGDEVNPVQNHDFPLLSTISNLQLAGSLRDKSVSSIAVSSPDIQPSSLETSQANKIAELQVTAPKIANILVVDDNGANCDLLCRYIIRQGHQVTPVSCGSHALAQIKTGAYDLILLDILMPEMNGYEVLEWIRQSEWRHLSVIMISSLDELDSVVKCIEMGAEDYLAKPFNPTLLKARIDACLDKKRMRDQEVQYLDQLAIANEKITKLNNQLQVENGRLSSELEVTQRIQQMMLPRPQELAQIEDLDVVGFMKPADEVGGDYYDVIRQDDGVLIGIGDVTGHGLESGLLMLMIQTAVRTLVEQGCSDSQQFLNIINRTILSNAARMETSRNSTLSLIHYRQGILQISGQHEEVIIIRSNGEIEHIDTINLGFPMGLDYDISEFLGKTEVKLNLQDVVVLYTDGITEAENCKGQLYGIDRLSQIAAKYRYSSAADIRDAIVSNLIQHISKQQIFDDITLLVMKRSA